MIQSMTGYGKTEAAIKGGTISIEIRTLNGKSADINLKTSLLPKDKEIAIRQTLNESLHRGTIDFFVRWEPDSTTATTNINTALLKEYYGTLKGAADECGASSEGLFPALLRFQDIYDSGRQDIVNNDNWPVVEKAILEAIDAVNEFRSREGEALYKDVRSRIENILELENQVEALENERIVNVRERLMKNLEELGTKVDPQRFEQEMIFYLEKLDINEEKVRLREHCRYFLNTLDNETCPGKKLGFIIQEIGREINTTGSKANHAGIQKLVILMKDELEKIREQSMNIL